jgi:hypothetical protein
MFSGEQRAAADSQPAESALFPAAHFIRTCWLLCVGVSAIILVPCFWQQRIQAGDLASHVYNAWLAQLIERGQAPGLWIATQWNNVLFDLALRALGDRFSLHAAENIAVSAAVLIFFWGAFALASAAARRAAWLAAPCLAMLAYGWTFQMGFFNYYLSLGFASFGLALLWRGRGWERAAALLLIPLIWLAHPLGVVLLAGAGAWVLAVEHGSIRRQLLAGAGAVAALIALRFYIVGRYQVFRSREPRYFFNGADQLLLHGPQYRWPLALLLALALAVIITEVTRRRSAEERTASPLVPLQLYGLVLLAILLLPETIVLPQYAAPAGFLHERLSCIGAIFACCALASLKPAKWQVAGFCAAAAVFFFYLYGDTAKINGLEDQAERIVQSLPPGARVLATIPPPDGSRIFVFHIVDRACTGRCFSYGNYEPGSRQFRVRASPGNRFATTSMSASFAMQRGEYTVQPQDLPLFQISRCETNEAKLCARALASGEVNGGHAARQSPSALIAPARGP